MEVVLKMSKLENVELLSSAVNVTKSTLHWSFKESKDQPYTESSRDKMLDLLTLRTCMENLMMSPGNHIVLHVNLKLKLMLKIVQVSFKIKLLK